MAKVNKRKSIWYPNEKVNISSYPDRFDQLLNFAVKLPATRHGVFLSIVELCSTQ